MLRSTAVRYSLSLPTLLRTEKVNSSVSAGQLSQFPDSATSPPAPRCPGSWPARRWAASFSRRHDPLAALLIPDLRSAAYCPGRAYHMQMPDPPLHKAPAGIPLIRRRHRLDAGFLRSRGHKQRVCASGNGIVLGTAARFRPAARLQALVRSCSASPNNFIGIGAALVNLHAGMAARSGRKPPGGTAARAAVRRQIRVRADACMWRRRRS